MLAGMAALAFLALQVSARGFSQNQGGYEVVAYFTNTSGLTDKAKVSLAGVTTVGDVLNRIATATGNRVTAAIAAVRPLAAISVLTVFIALRALFGVVAAPIPFCCSSAVNPSRR